jgi:hypothetical protein
MAGTTSAERVSGKIWVAFSSVNIGQSLLLRSLTEPRIRPTEPNLNML